MTMAQNPFRQVRVWLSGIAIGLVVVLLAGAPWQADGPARGIPIVKQERDQTVAVLLTAEFCGASRQEGFAESFRHAMSALEEQVDASGRHLVRIGVSVDHDPSRGFAFLEQFGPFDEIIAGNNWFGTGALRFVWQDHPGPGTLPQVILMEREMVVDSTLQTVAVANERLLGRFAGVDQIRSWAQSLNGDRR